MRRAEGGDWTAWWKRLRPVWRLEQRSVCQCGQSSAEVTLSRERSYHEDDLEKKTQVFIKSVEEWKRF